MQNNLLLFFSKNDIPFVEGELVLHNPSILQISLIGDQMFFKGCNLINFSKNQLNEEGKKSLKDLSDFEVLMTIIEKNQDTAIKEIKQILQAFFLLILPDYKISFLPSSLMFTRKVNDQIERKFITKENFPSFKNIVSQIFCFRKFLGSTTNYNPGGPQARALVKKFEERQRKLAELKRKKGEQNVSILAQYILILAVGEHKDINSLMQYTLFQLLNQFETFEGKQNSDLAIQAKLAGAENVKMVNWKEKLFRNKD